MRWKKLTIVMALAVLGISVYPALRLGSEFMPSLNEGTLLYMPATLPGTLHHQGGGGDADPGQHPQELPEVASVFGKAGRAATATDPAPLEMFETVINLKPEDEWRPGMTVDKLIAEMDQAVQMPGRHQRLDHADQGPHRHALHRHPHPHRHQGIRQGPGGDGEAGAERSRRW